jgi:ParB-like chromosome segregation protein Spo0J
MTVRTGKKGPVLVTGRHRLAAAKSLDWTEIDAFFISGDKTNRRLWTIAENLYRAGLTVLQRADLAAEWGRAIKRRSEDAEVAKPGGRQPGEKGLSKEAEQVGITREQVRRSRAIAGISAKAKKAAKAKGVANNQRALLEVANEPTAEAQVDKVHELAKRKPAGKVELSAKALKQLKRLKRTFSGARRFKTAWIAASELVRDEFVRTVLDRTHDEW